MFTSPPIDDYATQIRRTGTISRANTLKRMLTSVTNITDLQTGIEWQMRYLHRMTFCSVFWHSRTSGYTGCLTWTTMKQLTNAFQVQEPRLQTVCSVECGSGVISSQRTAASMLLATLPSANHYHGGGSEEDTFLVCLLKRGTPDV